MPRGKERPRHTRAGTSAYTPKDTRDFEKAVELAGRGAMQGRPPIRHHALGLSVLVTGFILIPKSWPCTKRIDALHHRIRPTCKPDWDNIGKTTDALKGVVFEDDAHITDGRVIKWYTDADPCLLIDVWPTQAGLKP
jgi:Holliday junction resolvase RusA-like endonuclease